MLDPQVEAVHVPGDRGFDLPSHGQLVLADGRVLMGRGRSDSERKGGHEADGEDKSHHSNGFLHGIPWKRHSPPVCLFWHESRGFVEEGESLKAVHGLPEDR